MLRRLIKTLAVALIVLPEPVTTVPGLLILFICFVVFKQPSLRKFGDLEELVKRSLQNGQSADYRRYVVARQAIVHHAMKLNLLSQPSNHPGKEALISYASDYRYGFDNPEVSQTVQHHVLKAGFSPRQANSKAAGLKASAPVIEHHRLKLEACSPGRSF